MKETKVYVDELPKSCVGCKYFAGHRRQCNLELCLQWSEEKFKFNDCPLIDIKTHDKEKDKQIKKLEQKVQELQELDNKRAFRLYCMLYDMLEEQDPKDVASRIDFMTSENYADICELYKTAKNLKQHDRELVKEVCEKIKEKLGFIINGQERIICDGSMTGDKTILAVLNQIQKEFEK